MQARGDPIHRHYAATSPGHRGLLALARSKRLHQINNTSQAGNGVIALPGTSPLCAGKTTWRMRHGWSCRGAVMMFTAPRDLFPTRMCLIHGTMGIPVKALYSSPIEHLCARRPSIRRHIFRVDPPSPTPPCLFLILDRVHRAFTSFPLSNGRFCAFGKFSWPFVDARTFVHTSDFLPHG